jgi:hypothetical protein
MNNLTATELRRELAMNLSDLCASHSDARNVHRYDNEREQAAIDFSMQLEEVRGQLRLLESTVDDGREECEAITPLKDFENDPPLATIRKLRKEIRSFEKNNARQAKIIDQLRVDRGTVEELDDGRIDTIRELQTKVDHLTLALAGAEALVKNLLWENPQV